MNKNLFAIVFFSLGLISLYSQDVHFSQYKEAPTLLNPALTGNPEGDWRGGINYRKQWTKVSTTYQTFNVTFDKNLFVYSKVFMIGGYLLADQVNNQGLTRYAISPSLAYRFDIKNNMVKVGIQPGVGFYSVQRNVSYPDQFNYETGLFDNTLPTSDMPTDYAKTYADLALGALWSRNINGIQPYVGVSFYHINRPNTSLYRNNKKIRLPVKSLISIEVPYQFTPILNVSPSMLLIRQRKSQELIYGADSKLNVSNYNEHISYVLAGIYNRYAKHEGLNSLVFTIGAEYKNYRVSVSFDEYYSHSNTSAIGSTFEISIIYTAINSITDRFSLPCDIF